MTKIFTDENGEKFEEVSKRPDDYDQIVIRPIDKPKWQITERASTFTLIPPKYLSEDQVQLIKELQEVIMAGIFGDNEHYFDYQVREVYNDARQAFQKGDE